LVSSLHVNFKGVKTDDETSSDLAGLGLSERQDVDRAAFAMERGKDGGGIGDDFTGGALDIGEGEGLGCAFLPLVHEVKDPTEIDSLPG